MNRYGQLTQKSPWSHFLPALIALLLLAAASDNAVAAPPAADSFESAAGWTAIAVAGARGSATSGRGRNSHALRIDFDFRRGGGEVLVHRPIPATLPENFVLSFAIRGTGSENGLELRLVDASGQNVWHHSVPRFHATPTWQTLRAKRRQFEFAWGPAGGGKLTDLGLIELVVTRQTGGRGTLWIDDLRLEPLPPIPPNPARPSLAVASALPAQGPEHLLDERPAAPWHSASDGEAQWLSLDFQEAREYGGLMIDWDPEDYATAYSVERSDDGRTWHRAYLVRQGNGGRDYLPLPESESRYVRLALARSSRGHGYGIRHLEIAPLGFSDSANHLFERMAHDTPRGSYPRYLYGEQTYWTVVGSPGTEQRGVDREGLLNEDGMLEVDSGAFSVEPFLYADGRLYTWADGTSVPTLERGDLPIPSVQAERGPFSLTVTALADDATAGRPILARYRVRNRSQQAVKGSLFLAARPFQVNPPWQALRTESGVSPIHHLRYRHPVLSVDGDRSVIALTRPAQAGATGFDGDPITAGLAHDAIPDAQELTDPQGYASAVLRYPLELSPGATRDVVIAIPGKGERWAPEGRGAGTDPATFWDRHYAGLVHRWEVRLDRVAIQVPPGHEDLVRALRSNLAYILIHRDGPALRPGSRRYARTWIRDAAVTSASLLALGHAREVRAFLRWYAGYENSDGAVPCCLDPWGPDSMIEHDSAGEFIYTVANYYRHSKDLPFLRTMWPQVARTVDHLAALRQQRLTPQYRQGESARFFGLIPESASHEGYMAKPVHSYWDDFWAVRGIGDAAQVATVLGDQERAERYTRLRDDLRNDLHRSIGLTQTRFGIDYVPGSAELGDFDPTSAAIALSIGGEGAGPLLPDLRRTFDRYDAELQTRTQGRRDWQAYTPYEFRNVGALLRLGQRDAAFQALLSLFDGRRPAAWNQWPEIVWRDPQAPRFLGDLPHTWVGAEFIQSLLALFADEGPDGRLVLGAGLPRAWVETPGGVGIAGLHTAYGRLAYHVESPVPGETRLHIDKGLALPPGGLVLDLPLPQRPRSIEINGKVVPFDETPPAITKVPADVVFRY